jgi:DNA-binding SARP family transcriptional activator
MHAGHGDPHGRLGGGMDHTTLVLEAPAATAAPRAATPDQLRLTLLGGFSLVHRDREISVPLAAQRLVAFLALQTHPLLRTYVAGTLWPDSTEVGAFASLRSTLWRLGRPGLVAVRATASHLRLAETVWVDTREVAATVRRLLDRMAPCRPEDLDPGRLTGELLADWSADDWLLVERERLRQLCLHGLEAMCERLLALGRHGEAIEAGLAAVRGEPLRESAHRALIRVHLAEDNHWEALRQYRWYERILGDELGIAPSSQITELVSGLRSKGRDSENARWHNAGFTAR